MDPFSGSGSWNMIPSIPSHNNNSPAASNQDHLFLSPQHQQQFFQQQQQQHQHRKVQQQQQQTQPQQHQQQNQHHQSLASNFHLLPLVENLADAIENGTRDQHSDALVNDLNNHFEKCQQLLSSISGSLHNKAITVEGQRRKLEESEQQLNQRRELINKYINSVEELIKSEP